ncbi:tetratricopeptide repeat protein [Chitiniphilus eburneus]|uniref:Tetratricopeptide repeat protein n=1 Tax=Chitiniphilus eburneus TaxID=2571148 RepID=A0A4U0PP98_9NEIS|nr:tetratricopeptide repeat protein [Chitiniphilus eburneus]TJZ70071.1 tetratricopeptide repeat protein [Chitiniphilus eburneus]
MPTTPRVRLPALLVLVLSLALGACATGRPLASAEPVADAASEPDAIDASAAAARRAEEARYPKQELSEDMLLRFLVGDIALQRGNTGLASQAWVELAQQSADPRVARRATEVAIAAGQLNQALDAASRWVAESPQSPEAHQVMVSLLIRANRLEEARPHLEALFAAQPKEIAPFLLQIHRLWDKQTDRKAALKLTQELTAPYPDMPEAHFSLAVAYANTERPSDALAELDKVDALRPGWEASLLYRAQLLEDQPAAVRIAQLEQAAKVLPKSAGIQNALARLYAENKRYPEAAAAYQKVLELKPDDLEALVGSGLVALESGDLDTANARLSAAEARAQAHSGSLRFYLGQIAEQQQRFADAATWYERTDGELKSAAQLRLVRVYAKLDRVDDAQALVAALPADTPEKQVEKAQIEAQLWREMRNYPRAYTTLSEALKRHPDNTDLLYDRSLVSDLNGNLPAAEADLRRYLELKPDSATGLNALGYTLVNRTDRVDEAAGYIERAIALEPDNAVILDSLGWLRFKQGRLNEAQEALARAHKLMDDPEIAAHLAEALWQLGRKGEAREIYRAALAKTPDNEVLQETGKRLGIQP